MKTTEAQVNNKKETLFVPQCAWCGTDYSRGFTSMWTLWLVCVNPKCTTQVNDTTLPNIYCVHLGKETKAIRKKGAWMLLEEEDKAESKTEKED